MTVVGREVVAAKASRSTHLKLNREINILTNNNKKHFVNSHELGFGAVGRPVVSNS